MSHIIEYKGRTYDLSTRMGAYGYLCSSLGLSSRDLSLLERFMVTEPEKLEAENAVLKSELEKCRKVIVDNIPYPEGEHK